MRLATVLSILAIGLSASVAEAASKPIFEELNETAPLSGTFADLGQVAPRSVFDDMGQVAPRSVFQDLNESAPRSDGVYGDLENTAP
jgi:hypothetical protein